MFSGIVEVLGTVVKTIKDNDNLHIYVQAPFINELKVDQSISHNGVCLTVTEIFEDNYCVTAVKETLTKTNLDRIKNGDKINLERCVRLNDRLDGHIVQGHVDTTGECTEVLDQNGSWLFTFNFPRENKNLIVDKGSVCVNGVSLTVVNPGSDFFSVAIIPYTYQHTNFHLLKKGDRVNIEFDIIGKYLSRYMEK
jgi:riboflavin synthase